MVRGPGIPKGAVRDDLMEHIDMTAMSLGLAGIAVPKWMQGRDVFARDYQKRDAVFAARDRCDETMEHLRSAFAAPPGSAHPQLPERAGRTRSRNRYKDDKAIVKKLRELHAAKKAFELTEKLLFAEKRPAEELYDLKADPFELNNLAADPEVCRDARHDAEEARRLGGTHRRQGREAGADGDVRFGHEGLSRRGQEAERRAEAEHRAEQEVGQRREMSPRSRHPTSTPRGFD
ncbi:MAG: hypothetical protein U0792_14935 [Gemmataceae bacterium]